MDRLNRRSAIASLAAGAATTTFLNGSPSEDDKELKRALAAGLNQDESRCWQLLVEATNAYLALPELHPMDRREVASAIHGIQYKLLARPTYRKYLSSDASSTNDSDD